MTVIDATDLIVGRLASVVAKRALLGEKIDIINCEKAVITGNKHQILSKYRQRRERGIPTKGPFIQRRPDHLVRRIIRGMLPYKKERGRTAFSRIKCHIGVPEGLEKQPKESVEEADISKLKTLKFIKIKDISKLMGAKL